MGYVYSDTQRETNEYALPNVEVFYIGTLRDWRARLDCFMCSDWRSEYGEERTSHSEHIGYWYAFGFPGCVWDSDPIGPFATEAEAIADAQTNE